MHLCLLLPLFFFFNDTATTEIYTLSLHDALPILCFERAPGGIMQHKRPPLQIDADDVLGDDAGAGQIHGLFTHGHHQLDRKSTRLNSSHSQISYAVFCLKKKKNNKTSRSQCRSSD